MGIPFHSFSCFSFSFHRFLSFKEFYFQKNSSTMQTRLLSAVRATSSLYFLFMAVFIDKFPCLYSRNLNSFVRCSSSGTFPSLKIFADHVEVCSVTQICFSLYPLAQRTIRWNPSSVLECRYEPCEWNWQVHGSWENWYCCSLLHGCRNSSMIKLDIRRDWFFINRVFSPN